MKSIFFTIAFALICNIIVAQDNFEKKSDESGIVFSGLWKPVKASDPASPLQLCLLVENTNDYSANLEFTVVFFDTGVELESSSPIKFCIPAGKKYEGRKYGLCLVSEEISNEKILSEAFDWTIADVEVKKTPDCK